ncbi:toll/interleukin-1 receptor domain-containing protein [Acinetobacter baumannii]|uniref:toll/interleukin-1 receptor domain-containing protein n=1 Tax=Acinetobacter baumannii TaxID=470 RepID=UPI0022B581AA|nr:toll/interleukin-1 receptor domain-containing protein [Acinetobacter baumannii]
MTNIENDQTPKVFISYSWTTPEHEEWVLNLANDLNDSGIFVVLDKWDLRPGDDSIKYMESMVLDPEITKIIMVIDKKYTERANARQGGVGTESTILSKELYSQKDNKNIVAVIAEPECVPPVFYSSRIFIDLSNTETYADNFMSLVRWIYNRFQYERPKTIGSRPSYITDDVNENVMFTNVEFKFALDAIEKGKPNASGTINSYLNKLANELKKLSIQASEATIEDVKKGFLQFQPHAIEYKKLLNAVCMHSNELKIYKHFRKFLEGLLIFLTDENIHQHKTNDFLLYETIIYQLFLSTIAILLKNEELEALHEFIDEVYIHPPTHFDFHRGERTSTFKIFAPYHHENYKALYPQKIEPIAALLNEHVNQDIISFNDLCEADIFLYLKSVAQTIFEAKEYIMWWPILGIYIGYRPTPLKIFTKAERPSVFDEVVKLFNSEDLSFIDTLYTETSSTSFGSLYIPRWQNGIGNLDVMALTNYKELKKFNLSERLAKLK